MKRCWTIAAAMAACAVFALNSSARAKGLGWAIRFALTPRDRFTAMSKAPRAMN